MTELAGERQKLGQHAKRAAIAQREFAAGRISAWRMSAIVDSDNRGDEARVTRLERRVQSLQRQLGDAQERITPPAQREPDAIESAANRAHQAFVEHTRALLAGTTQLTPQPVRTVSRSAPLPFGGCADCSAAGASDDEARRIHEMSPDLEIAR